MHGKTFFKLILKFLFQIFFIIKFPNSPMRNDWIIFHEFPRLYQPGDNCPIKRYHFLALNELVTFSLLSWKLDWSSYPPFCPPTPSTPLMVPPSLLTPSRFPPNDEIFRLIPICFPRICNFHVTRHLFLTKPGPQFGHQSPKVSWLYANWMIFFSNVTQF